MLDVRRRIAQADTEQLWRQERRRQGATENGLEAVEAVLGVALDAQYREFLVRCDGSPAIFLDKDLFGTEEFLGDRLQEARELIGWLESEAVAELGGLTPESVVSIAMSVTEIDVFVCPIADRRQGSEVIWIAGGEIERFPTFSDYFAAMTGYNERTLKGLRGEL